MKKPLSIILIFSLILSLSVLFTGCGGPATLEEYVENNSEAEESIESLAGSNMDVYVEGNTLIYTYKYSQTFDDDTVKLMKSSFKTTFDDMADGFKSMGESLEKESGIDDVTVRIEYLNGDGSKIYSEDFR